MIPEPAHRYSPHSARCAAAKPNRLLETSAGSEWASVLIDRHEGAGQGATFETHPTTDLTLVVATAGHHQIDVLAHGRWRSAFYQPGHAGMTPPGETARLRWRTAPGDQPFQTLHLYLPGSLAAAVAEEYRRIGERIAPERLSVLAFRDATVERHAKTLLAAHRAGAPDLYAAGAAHWLVTHLLSRQARWGYIADDPRLAATITDRRLARVIEFMSAHLDRAMTLEELAREAGISVHHFGRRFRESTGLGPAAYLTTLRMAQARLLLETTDLAVAEVAARCGYSRASAFATAFARHAGMAPRRYRRSA
ncbi:helix-turn-helix domain-containing protein [Rhizosaccharibacter radicis]|uniref:AraC family transcriptional regulator n=1 Tax=Rhizosaccharibacter radicis TaxID=2782605 RepID=A0ABT1VUL1_9PROT|nr:AraC family transcriptional regulator [Acetobacteraceae bacterium KSS12]